MCYLDLVRPFRVELSFRLPASEAEGVGRLLPLRWEAAHTPAKEGAAVRLLSPWLKSLRGSGLEELVEAIRRLSVKLTRSDSLTIHIAPEGLTDEEVRQVIKTYAEREGEIDGFHPTWCRSNQHPQAKSLAAVKNLLDDDEAVLDLAVQEGDFKVSLRSFLEDGNLVFRHHRGTLRVNVISYWLEFCQNFVEATKNSSAQDVEHFDPIVYRAANALMQSPSHCTCLSHQNRLREDVERFAPLLETAKVLQSWGVSFTRDLETSNRVQPRHDDTYIRIRETLYKWNRHFNNGRYDLCRELETALGGGPAPTSLLKGVSSACRLHFVEKRIEGES